MDDPARLERLRKKAEEKAANHAAFARIVEEMTRPLRPGLSLGELQAEHGRLRTRIMEMQQLVITGRFDHKLAQEHERALVAQIHKVEEAAHAAATGAGGLPGEADRDPNRAVR